MARRDDLAGLEPLGYDWAIDPIRKLPRLQKALTFHLPDGWRGEVVDLSAVGLRVRSLAVIPKGTVLEGTLALPDGASIPLRGEVIWSSAPDPTHFVLAEIGLELTDVPDAYLQALSTLFAE